jgi:hypothetical protein
MCTGDFFPFDFAPLIVFPSIAITCPFNKLDIEFTQSIKQADHLPKTREIFSTNQSGQWI